MIVKNSLVPSEIIILAMECGKDVSYIVILLLLEEHLETSRDTLLIILRSIIGSEQRQGYC